MIGFTRPKDGQRFLLVGSHLSTVPVGETPKVWPGCAGCAAIGDTRRMAETGTGSGRSPSGAGAGTAIAQLLPPTLHPEPPHDLK